MVFPFPGFPLYWLSPILVLPFKFFPWLVFPITVSPPYWLSQLLFFLLLLIFIILVCPSSGFHNYWFYSFFVLVFPFTGFPLCYFFIYWFSVFVGFYLNWFSHLLDFPFTYFRLYWFSPLLHSGFKANYATYPVFLVFSRLPNVFDTCWP